MPRSTPGGALGHDPQLQDVDTLIKRGVDSITPTPANSTEQTVGEISGAIANPVNLIGGPIVGGARSLAGMGAALSRAQLPARRSRCIRATRLARWQNVRVSAHWAVPLAVLRASALGAIADRLATGVSRVMSSVGARLPSTQAAASQNADAMIRQAAQEQGIDLSVIPDSILNNVRSRDGCARYQSNARSGGSSSAGRGSGRARPSERADTGSVTRDPRQFTTERNLRGIQGAGEPLMQRYADQNTALIDSLNRQGANEALGEYQTGRQLMDALGREDAASQARVAGMYAQAHAINGNDIPLMRTSSSRRRGSSSNSRCVICICRVPSTVSSRLRERRYAAQRQYGRAIQDDPVARDCGQRREEREHRSRARHRARCARQH